MGNVRGPGGAAQPLPDRREGRRSRFPTVGRGGAAVPDRREGGAAAPGRREGRRSRAGPEARRARAKPAQGREAAPAATMAGKAKGPAKGAGP